jgi:hypothetical protein
MPVLVDETTKQVAFNPVWLKWFVDLTSVISSIGSGGTSISHNGLTNLQGGAAAKYYHLTDTDYTAVTTRTFATLTAATVKATTVGGYKSSDNSSGYTGTITTTSLVGKTVTIKDGLITSIA